MTRDYKLAAQVGELGDDVLVDPAETAAVINLAEVTVRQRKLEGFPQPSDKVRHLRWRLGDVREWMRRRDGVGADPQPRRPGRPTKAEQVEGGAQ